MADGNEDMNEDLQAEEEEEEEEENDFLPHRVTSSSFHDSVPEERSGHVAVAHGNYMYVLGGYKNAAVRGYHDFYLPREELWIYNMETGRWKKKYTEGDIPQSMSGSCAASVDGVLYLFGGHHARGNTNEFYMLNLRPKDKILCWEKIKEFRGVPPTPKDKLGYWVYNNKLIFFGGYGYAPRGQYHGTFEFDESSFWNASHPRGWNNHVHFIDLETFTWNQPITKGKPPTPRAAHACATIGNRGYVFGGRYQDARTNDLYFLDLDTWEWNEVAQSPDQIPTGRSWHSLTPVSTDHLFLFGGFTTDKHPLSDAWIYSVSRNEWLRVDHSYADRPRLWHSACTSDEGEVVVFGGCANNLLAHHQAAHSNDILIFSVQPKSLVRLCLEAVIHFKEMLANVWDCFPKHLLLSVNQRAGSSNTSGS
ncbi:kelch domain-containing protein 2 [Callorhinchus milii]|uniref:Kelch domain-containing protein 2-like protein n=1 Tax=Callorhinchus milii TaxID=7868 RepID=K4G0S2_CALMI|nr:kelch domain-containing protein 2 [Callorhinchus milii]AFK11666.1 kelch domain-containing protein 2-like protein [Callorhinchus milii]